MKSAVRHSRFMRKINTMGHVGDWRKYADVSGFQKECCNYALDYPNPLIHKALRAVSDRYVDSVEAIIIRFVTDFHIFDIQELWQVLLNVCSAA